MGNILWLASYPKSGNTWLRAFLHNLLVDMDEPIDINRMAALTKGDSQMAWYEAVSDSDPRGLDDAALAALRPAAHRAIADGSPDTVFVKTHNALDVVDGVSTVTRELTAGAIYVVRNPLDVAVSYAHHLGQAIDAVIELMGTSNFKSPSSDTHVSEYHSDWSSHVSGWTAVAHPSLHVVRYEDMSGTPVKAFGGVAQFLGMQVERKRLDRAIRFSSFRELKAQEAKQGFVERTPAQDRFFRAGKAGGWRQALSKSQIERIVTRHRNEMARFDYLPKGY